MAKTTKGAGKKKTGILTAKDIMKGYTGYLGKYDVWTLAPIQTLPLEDKNEEWIKWNADWFEHIALRELPKKAKRLQKLYNLAAGVLNKSDYIIDPDNDMSAHLGIIGAENEQNILEQFFPIAPNILQVFEGKFLSMDKEIVVDAQDVDSINETEEYRTDIMRQIYSQNFMQRKQIELIKQGLKPGNGDPQQDAYAQEMMMAQQFAQAQTQFGKFRTKAAQWGQNFIDKFSQKHYFDEDMLRMFRDYLVSDEVILALNMNEDSFTHEVLRTMATYVNTSGNERYYSKSANFMVNIEFMTLPDIINSFGKKLTAEQVEALEEQYSNVFTRDIMFESDAGRYGGLGYYDPSKSDKQNQAWSVARTEWASDKAVENFLFSLNSENSQYSYDSCFVNPRLIRVSRIWWASVRKVGLLTKMEEGNPTPIIEEIDENFKVTEQPEYDNSLLKEKSAKTLIKGEHIDWTDVTEWRYVIKIGENRPYYNYDTNAKFENIYLDGQPIRFQFKGKNNLYDARPPFEGFLGTDNNTISVPMIGRVRPWQLLYNILNNKATKILPYDWGKILLMNQSTVKRNSLLEEDGLEPLLEYMDTLKDTKIGLIDDSRETAAGTSGRSLEPKIVDMSTIEQATLNMQLAMFCRDQAFQSIGISPQMAGQVGKSESATGVSQAEQAAANQIEPYFDQFINKFMPRSWQMILEAGQYYTVKSPSFSDAYLNSDLDKVLFEILQDDLLLRDLLVMATSKPAVKELVKQLQTLALQDNTLQITFLERAKTLKFKNPSQIIEELEKAEANRQQMEQQKYQQEQQLLQQKQKGDAELEAAKKEAEDARFFAKLENDKYIAELNAQTKLAGTGPSPVSEGDSAKISQNQQALDDKKALDNQKLTQDQRMHSDKMDLERRKLDVEDRKANLEYMTAVENKQSADLKFVQLQKQKAKNAASKK